MQEIITQLINYAWGVWRFRWTALLCAWIVAVCGWIWVWQLPEAFVGQAKVYVDTNSVLRPLLRGLTIQPNINQRVEMMSRTLLTRPNLQKLMRMTDLDLEVNSDSEEEEMLTSLRNAITLLGDRRNSSLYSIRVLDQNRDKAKRLTQAMITVFIENSRSDKRIDSEGAQDFIDEQISEYEKRLISAENRLARFKQENADVLPGSGGGYYARLQGARADLNLAQLALDEAVNRQAELQRQLDGEDPVFFSSGFTSTESMSPLDTRIQALELQLDVLLSRYTEKHPKARQIRAQIEELKLEKVSEYQRMRDSGNTNFGGFSGSPFYQGMKTMLAETEAREAELRVRVAEYKRRVDELDSKVISIPEIEAQLKQLDRDYAVISEQHGQLLLRRESARLSEDVEQNAGDVTFRVIDPPYVPLKAGEPNKVLLSSLVLAASIGFGVALALLLSLIRPVFNDYRSLMLSAGIPVLGSVSYISQPGEERRELVSAISFASLAAILLIFYAGVIANFSMFAG